jgi:hypothetical protein
LKKLNIKGWWYNGFIFFLFFVKDQYMKFQISEYDSFCRMLTNRDIYDIAALCSEDERLFIILHVCLVYPLWTANWCSQLFVRLFFKACGFGGDILDSTTMMYTRTASSTIQEGEQTVICAGRKLLLVPPLIERPYKSSRTII